MLLIVGWTIGYFGYDIGGLFHLIPVIALIAIITSLIPDRRPRSKKTSASENKKSKPK